MEPVWSLLYSQEPNTCPCREPDDFYSKRLLFPCAQFASVYYELSVGYIR
jgi:hypothetical protein